MTDINQFEHLITELYSELEGEESLINNKRIPKPIISSFPRKIHWVNYYQTVIALDRDFDHFKNYIMAELGVSLSLKNSANIQEGIILHTKCRVNNLKSLLSKYYLKYVQCKFCKSDNTSLQKITGISKLYELKCNNCLASNNTS